MSFAASYVRRYLMARGEKIVSLCKRRGFIFQSSEIYGDVVPARPSPTAPWAPPNGAARQKPGLYGMQDVPGL